MIRWSPRICFKAVVMAVRSAGFKGFVQINGLHNFRLIVPPVGRIVGNHQNGVGSHHPPESVSLQRQDVQSVLNLHIVQVQRNRLGLEVEEKATFSPASLHSVS